MKEAYVSYEIAKLLKEKGFDEKTLYHYTNCAVLQHNIVYNQYKNSEMLNAYSAPTHQMACAWLREVHNIDIEIRRSPNTMMYRCIVYKDTITKCITDAIMETYEDAVETALKYALEFNLKEEQQ